MLKYAVIAVLGIFAAVACGETEQPSRGRTSGKTVAMANDIDGEKIHKTRCTTCHGAKGNMGANGAANLQESKLPVSERVGVVTHGRVAKGMQAFKGILSPEEIQAVAQYTMKFSK